MPPIKLNRRTLTHESLYDANFALAMVIQTLFVLANCFMAHYNRWITFLGGDVMSVGFVMGAGPIVGLLMRPWIGQLINRLGAKTVWGTGFVVFGLAALANLLVFELGWPIYLLRSGLVLGAALVFASSLTYITQAYPISRRTEAIGTLGASGFMGMILGPFLGDLVVGNGNPSRSAFVVLFVAGAAAVVVPGLLLGFLRKPITREETSPVPSHAPVNTAAWYSPVRMVGVSLSHGWNFVNTVRRHFPGSIIFVLLAFGLSMTAPFAFLATYIDDMELRIEGVSMVGLFFWCYAGLGLVVRLTFRRAPERWGRRKVLLAGMIMIAIGMFCYAFVSDATPWMLVVPALVCGIGHALVFHTMSALALETFPQSVRGTGSAFTLMMMDVGFIGGAPLLGMIAEWVGYAWMFAAIGLTCVFAVVIYTWSSIPVWHARAAQRQRMTTEPTVAPTEAAAAMIDTELEVIGTTAER